MVNKSTRTTHIMANICNVVDSQVTWLINQRFAGGEGRESSSIPRIIFLRNKNDSQKIKEKKPFKNLFKNADCCCLALEPASNQGSKGRACGATNCSTLGTKQKHLFNIMKRILPMSDNRSLYNTPIRAVVETICRKYSKLYHKNYKRYLSNSCYSKNCQ